MKVSGTKARARYWVLGLVAALLALAVEGSRRFELGPWQPLLTIDPERQVLDTPPPSCDGLLAYLRRDAGESIDAQRLAEVAARTASELETSLDGLATGLDSAAADWRPVFARLAADHPPTVEAVLELYRAELERSARFVAERDLVTLPSMPLTVTEVTNRIFEESFPLAVYFGSGTLGVITRRDDPSYLANHCRICVPPLAVHEGVPGHHVAFALAPVPAAGESPGAENAAASRRNLVFQEGWAQYAEVLVAEQGYWEGRPAEQLGALRMMLLRATRAAIDVALHCEALPRAEAERRYASELGMSPDAAGAEVNRHLLAPGSKAAYLVGALQILALREQLAVPNEGLRAFHDRLLVAALPVPTAAREVFGVEAEAFPGRGRLEVR